MSPIVRTTKTKEGQPVFISANEYAKECGVSLTRAYEGLADASERLVRRYFSYINTDGKKTAAIGLYEVRMIKEVLMFFLLMKY